MFFNKHATFAFIPACVQVRWLASLRNVLVGVLQNLPLRQSVPTGTANVTRNNKCMDKCVSKMAQKAVRAQKNGGWTCAGQDAVARTGTS